MAAIGVDVSVVKQIRVEPISSKDANRIIRDLHYSGKVVPNSQVHFGVFLNGKCGGALQFGPPMDRRKMLGLVQGTRWNEMMELNRMALSCWLPMNSESRVLAIALRMLKKAGPWLKWVLTFADGCQSGDGTIYRACGFTLTQIKENTSLRVDVNCGEVVANHPWNRRRIGEKAFRKLPILPGFQLRYIYFYDQASRKALTVPEIPYSEIAVRGARMYKGKRVGSIDGDASVSQMEEGGSSPTPTLQKPSESTT